MARIALVTREPERTRDVECGLAIDLDARAMIALVARVPIPRRTGSEHEIYPLVRRQADVLKRGAAAHIERRLHDAFNACVGNGQPAA